jgi:hypothetical protein
LLKVFAGEAERSGPLERLYRIALKDLLRGIAGGYINPVYILNNTTLDHVSVRVRIAASKGIS